MTTNSTDNATKKDLPTGTTDKQNSQNNPEKRKKDSDDDTKNSGFRSSRIRDKESRTSDTGDPSVS